MRSLASKSLMVLLMLAMAVTPACSLLQGEKQPVSVITDRPATIEVDGVPRGETKGGGLPLQLPPLERNKAHLVIARSEGLEARGTFNTSLSGLGVLDTIGIFLLILPGITLITGHAFELSPQVLEIDFSNVTPSPPVEEESKEK